MQRHTTRDFFYPSVSFNQCHPWRSAGLIAQHPNHAVVNTLYLRNNCTYSARYLWRAFIALVPNHWNTSHILKSHMSHKWSVSLAGSWIWADLNTCLSISTYVSVSLNCGCVDICMTSPGVKQNHLLDPSLSPFTFSFALVPSSREVVLHTK